MIRLSCVLSPIFVTFCCIATSFVQSLAHAQDAVAAVQTFGMDRNAATRGLAFAIERSTSEGSLEQNVYDRTWTAPGCRLRIAHDTVASFHFLNVSFNYRPGRMTFSIKDDRIERPLSQTWLSSETAYVYAISRKAALRDSTDPLPQGVVVEDILLGDIESLLRAGGDPNATDERSQTFAAIRSRFTPTIPNAAYLRFQWRRWQEGEFGTDTVLHAAVRNVKYGQGKTITLLLKYGADVNRRGLYHSTPLHAAAASGYVEAVTLLLLAGADPNRCNGRGEIPLEVARKTVAARVANSTAPYPPAEITPLNPPRSFLIHNPREPDYVNVIRLLEAAVRARNKD